MKTLELNFANDAQADKCIAIMQSKSPVLFAFTRKVPSISQLMTKPEYQDVYTQRVLTFENDIDCIKFIKDKAMREIYDGNCIFVDEPLMQEEIIKSPVCSDKEQLTKWLAEQFPGAHFILPRNYPCVMVAWRECGEFQGAEVVYFKDFLRHEN